MNVYLIEGDGDYFGSSFKDRMQMRAFIAADRENKPVIDASEIVGWYYSGIETEQPILTDFGAMRAGPALLLRRPRTEVLRPMLREVGTILPMTPWTGHAFEAFVCDRQLDAIDHGAMMYRPESGDFFGDEIMQYAFKPEVVADATLFRAKGLLGRLFATDRFMDLVAAHGLTGLLVAPLWSSEAGPLVTFLDHTDEFCLYPPMPGRSVRQKRAAMRAVLARRDE